MNEYERLNQSARLRGRPTASTRTSLLRAGRNLFALRGYDGASIRAITRKADANLSSVTYHFGSKERLYEAVLESVLAPLAEKVAAIATSSDGSEDRMVRLVRAFFGHLDENPDLPHLMLQELAAGKAPPPPVERFLRSVMAHLTKVVGEGQAAGEMREGDPLLLAWSCIIQPIHFTLIRSWLEVLRSAGSGTEVGVDPVEHAVAFARAGLAQEVTSP
jgi:TetR/AcrR family transcriptional regulator